MVDVVMEHWAFKAKTGLLLLVFRQEDGLPNTMIYNDATVDVDG